MGLYRLEEPQNQPVDFMEVKGHCELAESDTFHDSKLTRLIATATHDVEHHIRRSLITQKWRLTLTGFRERIELPRPPLQSVVSVMYRDPAGVSRTLPPSSYVVRTDSSPGCIELAQGYEWPATAVGSEVVQIDYIAGYGDDFNDVPPGISNIVYELVAFRFMNRGDASIGIPKHIQWSLESFHSGTKFGYFGVTK